MKFVPVTVSVKPGPPATAAVGLRLLSVGTGLPMLKVCAFDVPPPGAGLSTVTWAVPTAAMSVAGMAAVSWVADTRVVGRAAPFQRTTEPDMKFVPVRVSVKPGPPAVAAAGLIPLTVGTGFGTAALAHEKLSRISLLVCHLAKPTAPAVVIGGGMKPGAQ